MTLSILSQVNNQLLLKPETPDKTILSQMMEHYKLKLKTLQEVIIQEVKNIQQEVINKEVVRKQELTAITKGSDDSNL